jgi:hypothetical protein
VYPSTAARRSLGWGSSGARASANWSAWRTKAEVGRVRAVDGPFAVVADQAVAAKVVQILDARLDQLVKLRAKGGVVALIRLSKPVVDRRVGIHAVFNQKDRCVRPGLATGLHGRAGPLGNALAVEIRIAVNDVNGRGQFGELFDDARVHPSVTGESEILPENPRFMTGRSNRRPRMAV